ALAAAWAFCGWTAFRSGMSYWLWLKGEEARGEMEWDAAERCFAESIAWDASNADPWAATGDVLSTRAFWFRGTGLDEATRERERTALAERAAAAYGAALERNPLHAMAVYGAGRTWALRGDGETALAEFRRAAAMNPYDRFLGQAVAKQLREMGRKDEAKQWIAARRKVWAGEGDSTVKKD
ncbi:MAG: hypothetical protein IK066_12180, partial [Kiritimatiellae bacterium]|nr:hypothetical protein [Kiritimatiellia bacterium]